MDQSQLTLEDIPNELLYIIFKHFSYIEMHKYKLVSSRWKDLLDDANNLNIVLIGESVDNYKWYYISPNIYQMI